MHLGNLDAKRDWGHAKDYVRAQWMLMQHPKPDDWVIATGEQYTVREFVQRAGAELGMRIEWRGKGVGEEGVNAVDGSVVVKVDPKYFRPTEVETLLGDASKARDELGWKPEISVRPAGEGNGRRGLPGCPARCARGARRVPDLQPP